MSSSSRPGQRKLRSGPTVKAVKLPPPVFVGGVPFLEVNRHLARKLGYHGTQAVARLARDGRIPGAFKRRATGGWMVPEAWAKAHHNPGRGNRRLLTVEDVQAVIRRLGAQGQAFGLAELAEALGAAGHGASPMSPVTMAITGMLASGDLDALDEGGEAIPLSAFAENQTVSRFRLASPAPVEG